MKSFILASLFASASALTVLPVNAQTDSNAAQEDSISNLVSMLKNATTDTNSEQLEKELLVAIQRICKNNAEGQDNTVLNGSCASADIDKIVSTVTTSIGTESPSVPKLLTALSEYGVDSDTITLAAITAGVDATAASEATAAGPITSVPVAPVIVTLPTTPFSPGAGGGGGDAGISEVGN